MDQTISGIVLDEAGGLGGVTVFADVPGCDKEYKTKTNKNGEFSLTLPAKPDFGPYPATLTYMLPEYETMKTKVNIGGLPLIKNNVLPNVQMSQQTSTTELAPLILNIFDAKR